MWLAVKRTVCFLRRVGNHSRRAAKDAASHNEFAYRLYIAPFTLRWMRSQRKIDKYLAKAGYT